jgi:hypothetical protein
MAMIKGFAPAPGIGVRQIVKRCNSLSYYHYYYNKNLNKGARDDREERSAVDDNIDDEHGNYDIPEEPLGSLPANPPLQPAEKPPVGLDDNGLPIARPRPMDEDIFCCRWAVVDHLSMAQSAGFAESSFNEVQHVWSSVQVSWAGALSDPISAIVDSLWMPHPNKWRGSLDLERKIKWKLLLPTLLLQKTSIHQWCERT